MVRLGILGAGNIAHRFAASLAHEDRAELVAASCRTKEKAEAFLEGVAHAPGARAYASHEELLQDSEVDAIYLALPHALHRQWALASLAAGKAVLSEKPAMLTGDEMREVAQASREQGVLFMEAMKPRFQPLYEMLLKELPGIGALRQVRASLCNDMLSAVVGTGTYHMTPGAGAGALLDCGTYCANWVADLTDRTAPIEVKKATSVLENGVDVCVCAEMEIGGVSAVLETAFDRAKPRNLTLVGEHGTIEVFELHRPERARVSLDGQPERLVEAPYVVDDFFGEIHHFVDLVEAGRIESDVMGLDESIRVADVLDEVRAAMMSDETLDK